MADKQLSALTAASALSTSDLFYVSQGGNSRKATGTQLRTLCGGGLERTRTVPVSANFTMENAGTATNADSTNGILVTVPSVATQIRFLRSNTAPPATPYSIIMRAQPVTARASNVIYRRGIILRNSTSGRILIFSDYDNHQQLIQRWTSYTAFSANGYAPVDSSGVHQLPWFKVRNDGTTLYFARSPDGEAWYEFYSETLATFINASGGSLDQIGYGVFMNSLGETAASLLQSWEVA